MLFVHRK